VERDAYVGSNGSTVFFGKVGEALVIDGKGNVYRGQLNVAERLRKTRWKSRGTSSNW
jgi:hypothetical protein